MIPRTDAKVKHHIQAIGTSSLEKGNAFASKYLSDQSPPPTVYASYDEVYNDPNVDCVYIGTPHSMHKRDCLNAIAHGKNILCEKALTITAKQAKEVFAAAKEKGVYILEAMKLRHRPIVLELRKILHEQKVIGDPFRMTSHFGLNIDIPSLPASSRYKDLKLGAGSLLDLGIYPLTWAMLTLDAKNPGDSEMPEIKAAQTLIDGVEVTTTAILRYKSTGRQGVISSTTMANGDPEVIARIDGTNGYVIVNGPVPSVPDSFTVFPKVAGDPNDRIGKPEGKTYSFDNVGQGFTYEADNTVLDIAAGKKESDLMPWAESIRVMEIMDEIRRQGGARYPQDDE